MWVKLSNSGNPLELQVPSNNGNIIGGWSNDSCMVISLKNSEKMVGYRGSKSVISKSIAVKEQRVNGSKYGRNFPYLRCTLTGFERNYPVKFPSDQIIQKRFFSIESGLNKDTNKLPQLKEPWFISGFTDAEGCFLVIIRKSPKSLLGWQIEVNFTINLHVRDLELLNLIKAYFGAGRIGKARNGCCDFTIGSLDQIITKVIPHFDKYQLITNKKADLILFK